MLAASIVVTIGRALHRARQDGGWVRTWVVLTTLAVAALVGSGPAWFRGLDKSIEAANALSPRASAPTEIAGDEIVPSEDETVERTTPAVISSAGIVPRLIEQKRRELLRGSNSPVGAAADLSTWSGLVRYLPQGILTALFAPLPWDWRPGASTGIFKLLASIEFAALVVLSPAVLLGIARTLLRRDDGSSFVLAYGLLTLIFLGLLMSNLGGLVRLRSQAILPLIVLATATGARRPGAPLLQSIGNLLFSLVSRGPRNPAALQTP
jgi:hypothetical protein